MQALTIYVTKGHPKFGGDEFSDWYYVDLVLQVILVPFVDLT